MAGVVCLAFGIGEAGGAWIARLRRSRWFDGLAPLAADLALSGGLPYGCWTVPNGLLAPRQITDIEIAAFTGSGRLPDAAVATIAISKRADQDDLMMACHLVTALRLAGDAGGRRAAVIVTIEADNPLATDLYVRGLLDRRAFVIRPGLDVTGDHLHHFALRAVTMPREKHRLISVDLADYLACWQPGRSADLHVIPASAGDAAQTLRTISLPSAGNVPCAVALNLHVHADAGETADCLAGIDQLASMCLTAFLRPSGDMVFTHADWLDGFTGSAELLIVHEGLRSADASSSVAGTSGLIASDPDWINADPWFRSK